MSFSFSEFPSHYLKSFLVLSHQLLLGREYLVYILRDFGGMCIISS
ncbi:hypothetical protein GYH30_029129 [Glycine max]|nr:hypothetical protein GYH30_029129 [Glycine max]